MIRHRRRSIATRTGQARDLWDEFMQERIGLVWAKDLAWWAQLWAMTFKSLFIWNILADIAAVMFWTLMEQREWEPGLQPESARKQPMMMPSWERRQQIPDHPGWQGKCRDLVTSPNLPSRVNLHLRSCKIKVKGDLLSRLRRLRPCRH
jgi:hypothetical protein